MANIIDKLENKVIVSVQAEGNEPLNTPEHMLALSQSVINGGAGGLRLCGIKNINYISKEVSVPIVGLTKIEPIPFNWLEKVYITATQKDLKELTKTDIEFIAIDGTERSREDESTLKDQIKLIKQSGKIVICDVSTIDEALNACDSGADLVSTTLCGYTKETRHKVNDGPNFDLLAALSEESPRPIILEGRVWDPIDVRKAFEIGAFAVIIGSAITRPQMITKRFVSMIPKQ